MFGDLGREFQESATLENVQSLPPVFDMPEAKVTITINPDLLYGIENAGLLPGVGPQALSGPVQEPSVLGDVFGAMNYLAHDVRDAGNNLMQAELKTTGKIEVPAQSVLDTSLTKQETHYTHMDAEPSAPPPAPNMMA